MRFQVTVRLDDHRLLGDQQTWVDMSQQITDEFTRDPAAYMAARVVANDRITFHVRVG